VTGAADALVLWLDEVEADAGPAVGGKFSSLAEMAGAGFGVPPAFAVTTTAYRAFMRESGLEERARTVRATAAGGDLAATTAAGEALGETRAPTARSSCSRPTSRSAACWARSARRCSRARRRRRPGTSPSNSSARCGGICMPEAVLRAPEPGELPAHRAFSAEFLDLRRQAQVWIGPYYDGEHLARAGDWLLALDPEATEPLAIAALLHDMERSVPGGPALDKVNQSWGDAGYNRAHCERSAEVVAGWLAERGASQAFVEGVKQPIGEHEFGGSPAGDLMQAADSISFLEVNGPLVARWVATGECSLEKGRDKLAWMAGRVRLERARATARHQLELVLADVDRRLARASA
jgi:hypothetical protein